MKVTVNRNTCAAYAECCTIAPALFRLGDDDVVHVDDDAIVHESAEVADLVWRAVDACPTQTLTVEEI